MKRSRVLVAVATRRAAVIGLALLVVVGGCSLGSSASDGSPASSSNEPVELMVGLGYIPSVQFAPFYLAQQAGYYRDAGLSVTFQNKIDPDLVILVGQGALDIGIADGTSVIPAVSQGVPIKYVTTIYAEFPNIVYAREGTGIHTAADLRGRTLGTPGKYGSSWIMLEALLASAGLKPSDLKIQLYPDFGQGTALAQGVVDAATGFINNEPVVLQLSGTRSTILRIDKAVPLPGNGLIAGAAAITAKRGALRAFIAATLGAMSEIEANPEKGLEAAIVAVPTLGKDRATQLAILKATIATWTHAYAGSQPGAIDEAAWTKSVAFMAGLSDSPITGTPPRVEQLVDRSLLPH